MKIKPKPQFTKNTKITWASTPTKIQTSEWWKFERNLQSKTVKLWLLKKWKIYYKWLWNLFWNFCRNRNGEDSDENIRIGKKQRWNKLLLKFEIFEEPGDYRELHVSGAMIRISSASAFNPKNDINWTIQEVIFCHFKK